MFYYSIASLLLDQTIKRYRKFTNLRNVILSSKDKRSINLWEISDNLKTSTEYAQLRYEQAIVIRQINKNFGLLQKTICQIQYQKWRLLSPPDLSRRVADYITGSIHSIGDAHFGIFQVQQTTKSLAKVEISYPTVISHGIYKVSVG